MTVNWKPTAALAVLFLGALLWVIFGDDKVKTNPELIELEKKAFPKLKGKTDDVTKVTLERGANLGDVIVLVKDGQSWKLEKPVADKCDSSKVRELLSAAEFLEWKDEKLPADRIATPEMRVTFTLPTGDVVGEIGASIPGEVRLYRVPGRTDVRIIEKSFADKVAWDSFEFRLKELVTTGSGDARRLAARVRDPDAEGPGAPPRLFELAKVGDVWRIGGSDGELADYRKATALIDKVKEVKPAGIATETPKPEELKGWGFDAPVLEVTLTGAGDETLIVGNKVGADETRYVKFGGRNQVYKADASTLIRELRKTKDSAGLRTDALFPLLATTDAVIGLKAKWKDKEVELKRTGQEWSLVTAAGSSRGDDIAIKNFVKEIADLKLVEREPAEASKDLAKLGLSDPGLVITLDEGGSLRVLNVGAPAPNEGVFYVRRGDEARVVTAKLGDLPSRLEKAALSMRQKTVFKASHWDATGYKLLKPDGSVESEASKVKNEWAAPPLASKDTDGAAIGKMLEAFDDMRAKELVAEVSSAAPASALAAWGLDAPRKFVETLEPWSAEKNEKKKEDKTLLIGKREGNHVYVMEPGSTVVAKVDAEFLDRIARGFRKGKELFTFSSFDVVSFVASEGDKKILELEKRKVGTEDEWFMLGPAGEKKIDRKEIRPRLLEHFEKLEGYNVEDASEQRKKDAGLVQPWRTVVIKTKATWGEDRDKEVTKTLIFGKREGNDVWAMDKSGSECGVVFDLPIRKLEAFAAEPPLAPEKPGAEKPKDDKPKGETVQEPPAPVASPDTGAVSTPSK